MKKLVRKQCGVFFCAVVITLSPLQSALVTWTTDVSAGWSFTDSLQGIPVTVASGTALFIESGPDANNGQIISGPTLRLSDATSPSAPTLSVLAADTDTIWLFDLTALPTSAVSRQLNTFSMWMMRAEGDQRRGVNIDLQISMDGVSWNTGWAGVQYDGAAFQSGTFNNLTFVFNAGEAVGFNYIRVVDKTFGGYNPIWTEWDAAIVAVPEPQTYVLLALALGCALIVRRARGNGKTVGGVST